MEIKKEVLDRYLEAAAIEQLSTTYIAKGYSVEKEAQIDDHRVDLLARKGDETIVFEVKLGDWSEEKRLETRRLRNLSVHKLGAKFKLVLVNIPEPIEIEIEGLESLFAELIADEHIDDFSKMATHFWIDEVSDIYFTSISIKPKETRVSGSGVVTASFKFGSDADYRNDDGLRWNEAFEFEFDILLDEDLALKEVYLLDVDTSKEEDEE